MSILVIGILAVMPMGLLAQRNITSGNIVTTATLLAQSELEKITNYHSLVGLKNEFIADPNPNDLFQISYKFSDPLARELESSLRPNCNTSSFEGSGTCLAVITVSWRRGGGGRGRRGEVQLKTLLGWEL